MVSELIHSAFYKFVKLDDVDAVVERLRVSAKTTEIKGAILLAPEGINGMMAGTRAVVDAFEGVLLSDARFSGMVFKRTPCKTPPFHCMRVHAKKEIVPMGIDGVDGALSSQMGVDVPPAEWRELIKQDDVVLLDNRNSFEFRLGRFNNAIDPGVSTFRDFPRYVEAHIDEWKRDGKRVAMYCTGGIRCEKTSAWMLNAGVPVYQLEGGILNYFAKMPDAEKDWQGECFVFDNRIALNTKLEETDTTLEDVYESEPDGAWRLARARRLSGAA